ncbi:MAG: hypothetical protein JWO71_3456 [Candidatus Acidoferrum typicum]|nr:hypothetical protein [Candidatus Acidoferrum typicum]
MATGETSQRLVKALERSLLCNILLVDAIFELLAEKQVISRDEVMERIKRLKLEASVQIQRVH